MSVADSSRAFIGIVNRRLKYIIITTKHKEPNTNAIIIITNIMRCDIKLLTETSIAALYIPMVDPLYVFIGKYVE